MAARLDLNLHSGNAAFEPDSAAAALARILRKLADHIEAGQEGGFNLGDVNGNQCGRAWLEVWDDEAAA